MVSIIYFDEGEYQKEWDELIRKSERLGHTMISVKKLDELYEYITDDTLIYTVPRSIKSWMETVENNEFTYIIIGPDRGALSTWLTKNEDKVKICKFRTIKSGNDVKSAFKIGRIILNGR
jgi:hypothetical protein